MDTLKNIIDGNNISYDVVGKIGEGSQGETFLLQGESHIAKLYKNIVDPTELKSKIHFLINLGLDKRYYSVPLKEITAPRCGYISEFASGMVPLATLKNPGKDQVFSEWYQSTGGLLKRYGVLIKLAKALRTLHAKGLVYCDLSPNNVFISADPNKHNVFLIDMDNVRYKTSIIHNVYTPFYGAPEVVKNLSPNTPMSDCYSFAVMAYELLAFNHPLIGDLVADGEPELEEQAVRGELPWVEDSNDASNARSKGLPSAYVISKSLQPLFKRTFENGLNDSMLRPSMGEWMDALNAGLNELLLCRTCHIHYPYRNALHCPFCGKGPGLPLIIKIQRWEREEYYSTEDNTVKGRFVLQPMVLDELYIDENTPKYLKAFHLLSVNDDYDTPIAQLKIESAGNDEARLTIRPHNDYVIMFKIPDTDIVRTFDSVKSFRFKLDDHKQMIVGVKNFSESQRVLVI